MLKLPFDFYSPTRASILHCPDAQWPEELLQHRKAGIHTVRGMEQAQAQALVGDQDLLAMAPLLHSDFEDMGWSRAGELSAAASLREIQGMSINALAASQAALTSPG